MATKFEIVRPVVFEISFRSEAADRVADALSGRPSVVAAESGYVQANGFGIVTARVSATNETSALRRFEKSLDKLGTWDDRSRGEFGPDAVLVFIPAPELSGPKESLLDE